jgi:peptidyl-prolyl cis-trans isomerase SurA
MTPTGRVPHVEQITARKAPDPSHEKNTMIRTSVVLATLTALVLGSAPSLAQDLFAPRLYVDDRAITGFEVEQRMQMLRLFATPGDPETEATKALVEDRLRMTAAKTLGIAATPEQIRTGMDEFAGRADMTAEQFVAELGKAGVSAQTFRDFVEAGLVWREVIRLSFAPKVVISDAEIDRAISAVDKNNALQVLISELVIPADPGEEEAAMARAQSLRAQISTEGGFEAAARQNSASATAARGGRLDWMPLAQLPAALSGLILGLSPGEVSEPVALGGAIGLFQLRGLQEIEGLGTTAMQTDYAQYLLPAANGPAEAAALRARIYTCNDLYGENIGLPADRLTRETMTTSALPANIGRALADLDANESVDYPAGAAHVFLMLCARTPVQETPPDRNTVREQLFNARLGALANSYLAELRFNAIIREP